MIINQLNSILKLDFKIRLFLLLLITILITIFEFLSIGSIPLIISVFFAPSENPIYYGFDLKKILSIFPGKSGIENILYLMILIFTLKFIFNLFYIKFEVKLSRDLKTYLSKKFYNLYIYSNYSEILKTNSATIIRNIVTEGDNSVQLIITLLNLIKEILLVTVVVSLLIIFEPFISSISLILILFITVIFYLITSNYLKFLAKKKIIVFGNLIKIVNETFYLFKEIIVFNKEKNFLKKFISSRNYLDELVSLRDYIIKLPKVIFEYISVILLALLVLYFSNQKGTGEIIAFLSLFVLALIRLVPSFNQISSLLSNFTSYKASFKILYNLIIFNEKLNNSKKNQIKYYLNTNSKYQIIFKNVFFDYSSKKNKNSANLKNISFKIKKGEFVGIIGKSGSGKSTLINLILGLLKHKRGEIKINNDFNKIGYVPQDTYLIDDTIKANITLDDSENPLKLNILSNLIKDCELEDLIQKNKFGINTKVGDKGSRLSGGERQRIGLARVLYHEKDIIVLDEPTSALDNLTEQKILKSISNITKIKNKTVIMIAHRLSSLKKCDRVILIDNGEIKAIDTLDNLFKKSLITKFKFEN